MDSGTWTICVFLGLWGLVYLILGVARKRQYQMRTGIAVILLAASMPLMEDHTIIAWLLIAIGVVFGVSGLVLRFKELARRPDGR